MSSPGYSDYWDFMTVAAMLYGNNNNAAFRGHSTNPEFRSVLLCKMLLGTVRQFKISLLIFMFAVLEIKTNSI